MDLKTRAALLNESAKWLDDIRPEIKETDALNEMIVCLKDAATRETLDAEWVKNLTLQFRSYLFFDRFLYRMR